MENNSKNKKVIKSKTEETKVAKKKIKKKKKKDNNIFLYLILVIVLVICCTGLFLVIGGKKNKTTVNNQNSVQSEANQNDGFTKYRFKYKYILNISGNIDNLEFILPIPKKEQEKQYITELKTNIKPAKVYKENGTTFAKFSYEDVSNQKIDIELSGIAKVRTYNIKTAKSLNIENSNEEDLNKFLKSEKLIESDDSYIINIANQIQGNSREEILQNMYEYIQKHMTYRIVPEDLGAKKALQEGFGKCSEHAAIMVALCRAKGIPARISAGNIAREQNTRHAWVEVYFDEYGWVTYDPTAQATEIKVYDQEGKLVENNKEYDTSPDIKYIKSGINIFTPFFIQYSGKSKKLGKVDINENIKIEKIN